MIPPRRRRASANALLAAAIVQSFAGVLLIAVGLVQRGRPDRDRLPELLAGTVKVAAAAIAESPLDEPEAVRRRLAEIAAGLGGTVAVVRDGRVLASASAGRIDESAVAEDPLLAEASRSAVSARREGTSSRFSSIVAAAPLPGDPQSRLWISVAAEEPPSHAAEQVAIAAGGLLLLLLPATIGLEASRRRRGRRDELAARIAAAAERQHPLELHPDTPGDLLPLAEATVELDRSWRERLLRLDRRIAEREGLIEAIGSGLITLDRQQRVRSLNAAAATLLAIDPAAARDRLLQELIRSVPLHRLLERAASGSDPGPEEFAATIAGREVVLQATCSRVASRSADSDRGSLLLLITDVTRLRRLQSLRSAFAANVSHELRTPITNIKGYVETLLEVGFDEPEQSRRFLGIVRRNADRLATIIEDLLTLAQLEDPEARHHLDPQPCAVQAIVAAVLESLGPAAEARRIRIEFSEAVPLRLVASAPLLEQALANLVSNAIKYSPEGSAISIRSSLRPDGAICLSVRDNGPGIPREHLARLFERFYRIDRARSREHGGTGLGLSIVKHIAAVHGGQVEVESEPGRGSEFRFVVPPRPPAETSESGEGPDPGDHPDAARG